MSRRTLLGWSASAALLATLGAATAPRAAAAETDGSTATPQTVVAEPGRYTTYDAEAPHADQRIETAFSASLESAPATVWIRSIGRRSGRSFYAALLYRSKGKTTLAIEKTVNGDATLLAKTTVASTVPAGATLTLDVTGSSPVALTAVLRPTQEASTTVSATDSSDPFTEAGSARSAFYCSRKAKEAFTLTDVTTTVTSLAEVAAPEIIVGQETTAVGVRDLPAWGGAPVFEDTFSDASLDTTKWGIGTSTNLKEEGTIHLGYLDYEWGVPTKECVFVADGALHVRMKRLDTPESAHGSPDGGKREWATGYVSTQWGSEPFTQEYGRWEFCARFPSSGTTSNGSTSRGMWGGGWLMSTEVNGGADQVGEIDMAESYGSKNPRWSKDAASWDVDPTNRCEGTIHLSRDESVPSGKRKAKEMTPPGRTAENPDGVDLENEWHTWAAERTPEGTWLYFDGKLLVAMRREDYELYDSAFQPGRTQLDIRFCMQAGNKYWGKADETTRDQGDIVVDYVRAWAYPG
ncbi:MAG: family 16 glycosylhydrolase [Actinomyces sp.]|uniref:glycoside hydrolase family 16 protein n=1 Tax=Actinomyces sp. TaxID=29317 RepID=UPI0026DC7D29|nr:family 16 glycosylhydrolase [Actinomyces sp.]MDO4242330.1 family 16 glycosylhydrolase [Actinomyces sp.]